MKQLELKYGCNPNQKPASISVNDGRDLPIEVLNGKPGYINFMDALNSWQLVKELKEATGLPAAASFKHVSPAGAAVGLPLSQTDRAIYFVDPQAELTPMACAYIRARGADRLCSYGDWAALSDTCDAATAAYLKPEVSDGIIAPDYTPEALEILKSKKKGGYNIVKIDPAYVPAVQEHKDVFGITFEQGRNNFKIDASLLTNLVTENKTLPDQAKIDMIVALITLKYTQSNSVCYVKNGQAIGVGAGQQSRIHCTRLAGNKADNWYLRQHPKALGLQFLDTLRRPDRDNAIDFAVVAPDDPLVLGAVDLLEEAGIACFGPNKAAAILEGSKVFSKDLMKKYHIPTAEYRVFDNMDEALDYLKTAPIPTVVKADGLALGKGVTVAMTRQEAVAAVRACMEDKIFGESGSHIVIEEFLTGPEVSVLSFTDGKVVVPMVSSMDHKRIGDGDTGPNTGGMGTIAPNPYYTEDVAKVCMETIFLPTMRAMNQEGRTFRGCLYFGLMLTEKGPKVIEYNCRFGDPETQVVLPLLESDLLTIMEATAKGTLSETPVQFSDKSACCLVLASQGYPKSYETGYPITIPADLDAQVFVAGAKLEEGVLKTSGGRVLGVTAVGDTLQEAIDKAYREGAKVTFENAYYRKDIGARALRAKEEVK